MIIEREFRDKDDPESRRRQIAALRRLLWPSIQAETEQARIEAESRLRGEEEGGGGPDNGG